jgi:hypothetical protein
MNLNDLFKETYALGFEEDGELDESFAFAANRALRMIHEQLSAETSWRIQICAPKITSYIERYRHIPGSVHGFPISGESISYRYSGQGSVKLYFNKKTHTYPFSSRSGKNAVNIAGAYRIEFIGDYDFCLYDFCVFESKDPQNVNELPYYSKYTEHDLTKYIKDFHFATRMPTLSSGGALKMARLAGDKLTLPTEFDGEITVYYKRQPEKMDVSTAIIPIDIPKTFEHLLAILTASFVWLDDDEEKAAYYFRMYKEDAARLTRSIPKIMDNPVLDVTGWA